MAKGYIYEEKSSSFICLICGKSSEKGVIYKRGDLLIEAEKEIKFHINEEHESVFNYLINMDKKYTNITDSQKKILKYFYEGLKDKDIIEREGEGSTSTIRNYRFKLREREKQAKVFISIMSVIENNESKEDKLIEIHRTAKMVDDRFVITEAERDKIIKNYFKNGKLTGLPSSEKKKVVILQYILKSFQVGKEYNEKEVNEILKLYYKDFASLRRYLIEYGFMERDTDCSNYKVKL